MEKQQFDPIEKAIEAIAAGRLAIVVDAEDRENEGDFLCAAAKATPELVNFMLAHGRGLLCVAVLPETAARLNLRPMVEENTAPLRTAFTVSVDHYTCKTGVSAYERAKTIRSLADPSARAEHFLRPGHVHPLVAQEGGVLRRAGHTEAAVDLARLAGLQPAGALCEILDQDGRMARRPRLFQIAHHFDMPIISIEDIIRHRRSTERLVRRKLPEPVKVPSRYGLLKLLVYEVAYEEGLPLVIIIGEPERAEAPLVRMHSACFTGDLLESLRCDCGDQLHIALDQISREGCGVLVYLPQEGRGIGLVEKLRAYQLQDQGLDTVEANLALGYQADPRDYGIGAQVLKDLGLKKIRLLTNNPKKIEAINFLYRSFDLQVVDQIPIVPPPNPVNIHYLAAKRDKLGHRLPQDLRPEPGCLDGLPGTRPDSNSSSRPNQDGANGREA